MHRTYHLGENRSELVLQCLIDALRHKLVGFDRVAIDDIETQEEVAFLRTHMPRSEIKHFYLSSQSIDEMLSLEPEEVALAASSDFAVVVR